MTFLSLLLKEMRLNTRRERTIWLLIIYVLLLGIVGWLVLDFTQIDSAIDAMNTTGSILYTTLAFIQLTLLLFITPAFTATAINGEKERQTFDLLLCSQLTSFSIALSKLLAGVFNAITLLAASLPLFSLVFFFGGVSPTQMLQGLMIFLATTLFAATLGLFCSALFRRPTFSTAIGYVSLLLWLAMPLLLSITATIYNISIFTTNGTISRFAVFLTWSPVIALLSSYATDFLPNSTYAIGSWLAPIWILYILWMLLGSLVLFIGSLFLVKPGSMSRWKKSVRHKWKQEETKITVQA